MARDGPASRAVSRLDAAVARAVAGEEEPILAFSGGLGSLVVAALARKRCDLRFVVVGLRGSADVQAATVAHDFLDYRVSVLRPTRLEALCAARAIAAADPRLPLADVLALVPLVLVEAHHPSCAVLSGFGLTARDVPLRRALATRRRSCPGLGLSIAASPRTPLLRIAEAIGLPESFILAAPRTPIEGSGIGPLLRAMAHAHKASLGRLISDDKLVSDYHKRPARPDVFKSLHLD